jgi:1-acyl-sn-glycerol-3-phosphate acyltransferase
MASAQMMTAETPTSARRGVLAPLSHELEIQHASATPEWDADFVRHVMGPVRGITRYFTPEVRGLENLPATGPVLVVSNHSGLYYMPDAWVTGLAVLERRGLDHEVCVLAHDLILAAPGIGPALRRIGAIPADPDAAAAALGRGSAVVVFPGGAHEACRPWTARDTVDFGGHRGFLRLALRAGVPVVPVVGHGSHDAVIVLTRGDRIARLLGLGAIRVSVCPIVVGAPFGVGTALTPPVPLPSTITVEFLPAFTWPASGDGEIDEATLTQRYDEVTGAMQAAMDRLHRDHPHPVAEGAANLARQGAAAATRTMAAAVHRCPRGRRDRAPG